MSNQHYYSPATGELIVTDTPAEWMSSTDLAPPMFDAATQSAFFRGGAWIVESAVPDAGRRRAEILARLAEIDAESIRPAREISAAFAAGQPAPTFAIAKLAALESEAADLRADLRGLSVD